LENKVFDIIDTRCNHEVAVSIYVSTPGNVLQQGYAVKSCILNILRKA